MTLPAFGQNESRGGTTAGELSESQFEIIDGSTDEKVKNEIRNEKSTAATLCSQVRETPNVAQTDRIGNEREDEFKRSIPFVIAFILHETAKDDSSQHKERLLTDSASTTGFDSTGVVSSTRLPRRN